MTSQKIQNLSVALGSLLLTLAFTFLIIGGFLGGTLTYANSGASNVQATENVQTYCIIAISNSAINMGSVNAGSFTGPTNLIVANSAGNANGNIVVFSTSTWTSLGNTFVISNTLWNPSSNAGDVGNALTAAPVTTAISLITSPGTIVSNSIWVGANTPVGQAPGAYTSNIELEDSCAGTNLVNTILTITIPGQCYIYLSNTFIAFPSLNPSFASSTSNVVTDNSFGGNIAANILIQASNWISGGNNFFVSNTLWNPTTSASYIGNAPNLAPATGVNFLNTNIEIPYPPTTSSNNIFFGVGVPPGEPAGVYTQNIQLENLC